MTSRRNETAVITGATSGIGRELAFLLAARGYDLLLVARSHDRLAELAAELLRAFGVELHTASVDLSVAGSAETIAGRVQAENLTVTILVNSAGFGTWGDFAAIDPERSRQEIQVNVSSLVHLTRILLPGMIARRHGIILNVSSTAGFYAGPWLAVYYATKAFVLSFSEGLREELAGTGISVSVLCPGETSTGFQERAGMEGTNLTRGIFTMDAATVARCAVDGMFRGKAVIIPGWKNKVLASLSRIAPRWLSRKVTAWLNSKRSARFSQRPL